MPSAFTPPLRHGKKVCRMKLRSLSVAVLSFWALSVQASTISLGTAGSFAVLAGRTVTNIGSSTVFGNLGVAAGSAVTGFPPGIVSGGTIHTSDGVALQAQNDLTTAYTVAAGQSRTQVLTGTDLGGMTLLPGVYFFASSAQLTGALTLNSQGDPNAVFVFQIGSDLTTASDSSIVFTNSSLPVTNLFWQVGSSATLGTTSKFAGNILALTSIAMKTGATIDCGRALARNGEVTMQGNTVTIAGCESTSDGGGGAAVPEPGTAALFGIGLLLGPIALCRRLRKRAA